MTDLLEETAAVLPQPAAAGSAEAATARARRKIPKSVLIALTWLGLVLVLAVIANVLPLKDPSVDTGKGLLLRPFQNWSEPLGTDQLGRSELSRVIYGARVSLFAACTATAIALIIGVVVGMVAGYFRGKVDGVIGIVIDSVLAFPGIMLLLILAAVLGPGVGTIIIGLVAFGWVSFARLTRANTLQVANADYIAASRGLGAPTRTILFREMLPNVIAAVAALAPLVVGGLILAEAAISFLGLGVRPPTPSWGNMISDARNQIRTDPHLLFVPAVMLFLTIFAVNTVGEWLRRRSDAASRL
jgi:peptide/nickel transport system permease protein